MDDTSETRDADFGRDADSIEAASPDPDPDPERREVLVVGGGVAGLSAAVFTARAGLDTLVCNHGESILRRNAHLANFPGFPAGVDPRLFADMLEAQATRNGAELREGRVTALRADDAEDANGANDANNAEVADGGEEPTDATGSPDARFVAEIAGTDGGQGGAADTETDDRRTVAADYVIAASWSDVAYLDRVDAETRAAGSKTFVGEDGLGRTTVEGLYVAGRLAERYHQAVVAAGHGAQTAITLVHDSETPFYHDWVVPVGYFTDRGREVPPGCEEIDATEQAARQAESRAAMREYFDAEHDARQRTHPSLVDDERGRLPEEDW